LIAETKSSTISFILEKYVCFSDQTGPNFFANRIKLLLTLYYGQPAAALQSLL